jgi:GNAT superfamily N-acetyltransferase
MYILCNMKTLITFAQLSNIDQIKTIDRNLPIKKLKQVITEQRIILAFYDDKVVGILRFAFFWEIIPMINFIYLEENYRGLGLGRMMHDFFELNMKKQYFDRLMTTTQSDEEGQHFFRKIGYVDHGSFKYPNQAEELILFKDIT